MKRGDLVQHMRRHDCGLDYEGGNHSIWRNSRTGAWAAVPRHQELDNNKVADICKQLGIPRPAR